EVGDLRERMRNLEQYSRVNNIEISGVPATRNEDISVLVEDVGAAIGVEVREMDIAAAYLVPSFRKYREPSVIVQFKTRGTKEQWIEKSRQKKNLTARDVNQHFPVQQIFINVHLSPENKQSLTRLKQKGRELSYKFVWFLSEK
ncbi:anchor protein 17A, partial [Homalodisca vitripennis]